MDTLAVMRGARSPSLVAVTNALLLATLTALAALTLGMESASAHASPGNFRNGYGSVDLNQFNETYEINYGDYTYDTEMSNAFLYGVDRWNEVNAYYGYNGVDINEDSVDTYEDLAGGWEQQGNNGILAVWQPQDPYYEEDAILFNYDLFYDLYQYQQNNVGTHEFGHALGFADLYAEDSYYYGYNYQATSILYNDCDAVYYDQPQGHDYYDFEQAWVSGYGLPESYGDLDGYCGYE